MRNSKWRKENKSIRSNSKVYKKALAAAGIKDGSVQDYRKRLAKMYLSPRYKEYNIYPSTDTTHVYAVIAMCLELKKFGLSDSEIIDAINRGLCKIFCMTDETAYAGLTRHVQFIRHSDLSDGESCTDEVMRKK